MRNRLIFVLAVLGLVAGAIAAHIAGKEKKPPPPAFTPASNPYARGVYANGIVESYQASGANINIYPEVPGTIVQILVTEGQGVARGTVLLAMDDSVQRAAVEQQTAQLEAARALLAELRAEPRAETLEVAKAQVEAARAALKTSQDQLEKQRRSFQLESRSVSKDTMDNAENAVKVAEAGLRVAERQLDLVRAGAWSYDIKNQESQCTALSRQIASSTALLNKYTIRAPMDGRILAVNAAVGSYVSAQGSYDSYTQGYQPVVVMGSSQGYVEVRCYLDEILVHRLPEPHAMRATMFLRGTDVSVPLEFVRVQPYVSPKIELSNQRTERVDVRVLPLIFRFQEPAAVSVYPGQLVDVYIAEK
ncbi:MAG TPA: biotin/lipoyl-binding protein [Thermoanaerobaculia bacterium]|nr:biotin/lipoyl-binding protein [Thermoanaerobaculia bacterium]